MKQFPTCQYTDWTAGPEPASEGLSLAAVMWSSTCCCDRVSWALDKTQQALNVTILHQLTESEPKGTFGVTASKQSRQKHTKSWPLTFSLLSGFSGSRSWHSVTQRDSKPLLTKRLISLGLFSQRATYPSSSMPPTWLTGSPNTHFLYKEEKPLKI